jgi:hypothetical protein
VVQFALGLLSALVIVAVAFLPWREVGPPNPFVSGSHLPQMGLPWSTAGLVVMAVLAFAMGLFIDRGDWPTRLVIASGVGIVVLVLAVQVNPATSVLITSSWHIHLGDAVAILAGVLIAFVGTLGIVLRTRSSHRGAFARS